MTTLSLNIFIHWLIKYSTTILRHAIWSKNGQDADRHSVHDKGLEAYKAYIFCLKGHFKMAYLAICLYIRLIDSLFNA